MKKLTVLLMVCLVMVNIVSAASFLDVLQHLFSNAMTGRIVNVDGCDENTDLALNKEAKASSSDVLNKPARVNDGKDSTYWDSSKTNAWVYVDLGSAKTVNKVKARWSFNTDLSSFSKSKIEISTDRDKWYNVAISVITAAANREEQTVEFPPTLARYIRFSDEDWHGSTIKLYSLKAYQVCKNTKQCTETEGKEINKKGTSTLKGEDKTDYCSSSTDLVEYYCSNDKSKIEADVIDCQGWCKNGACVLKDESCSDNVKNGDETGVDCGGSCITKCDNSKGCKANSDCRSGMCGNGICKKTETACSIGQRKTGKYCNEEGTYTTQKPTGACENSHECKTNLCVDSNCVSSDVWQKLLALAK